MSATIYDACRNGGVDAVRTYIAGNGSLTDHDAHRMTLLHHAAFGGCHEITSMILRRGSESAQRLELDAVDVGGWTPLHYAADRGHVATAELLLNEGASANAKDESNKTPLHLAAAKGDAEMVRLLLAHGASRTVKTVAAWDAKRYATEAGHQEVAGLLG